jgi:hypothetical protein
MMKVDTIINKNKRKKELYPFNATVIGGVAKGFVSTLGARNGRTIKVNETLDVGNDIIFTVDSFIKALLE